MKTILNYSLSCLFLLAMFSCSEPKKVIWLDELDLSEMKTGWGSPQINKSFRETPLLIGNQEYSTGSGDNRDEHLVD